MFKFLLVPILALVLLFQSSQVKQQTIVDRVSASTVRITGEVRIPLWIDTYEVHDTVCTGFVISQDIIMTAAHCLGEEMRVDGADAEVIKADGFYDLAILHTKSKKTPLLFRVGPPHRYEPLVALGYANGWSKLTVMEIKPFLINFTPRSDLAPAMYTQGGFIPGMSGGPVVDADGNVVMIIQQTNSGVGRGLGSDLMRAFLIGVD